MSTIRGILVLLLLLLICPCLCGSLFVKAQDPKASRALRLLDVYIRGLVFSWALFELIAIAFIVPLGSFRRLCLLYGAVLGLCTLAALIKLLPAKRQKRSSAKPSLKPLELISWLILAVFLLLQSAFFIFYQHPDGDDAYYIAQSVITLKNDTMYQTEAYTGYSMPLDARHALGAFPIWISWLSLCSGVHPTILAHSILAPYLLLLMYLVYLFLSVRLWDKKKQFIPCFLLLIAFWYLISHPSLYTAETFAYGRIWQGKAVFANIIVPLSFAFLYDYLKEKKGAAICLLLNAMAAVLCSTASIFMLGILYGCAGLCIGFMEWKKNKTPVPAIRRMLPVCLAALPLFFLGLIYLGIR